MEFKNKRILIVGAGKSGLAAAELLGTCGAGCVLFDENTKNTPEAIREKLSDQIQVQIIIGTLPAEMAASFDLVILSPGVPCDTPFVDQFRNAGIPIWGELELGYQFMRGRLIAITGTNGKTTTTTLTGQIMQDIFASVFVVGNIGNPITLEAMHTDMESVTVAEVSSFQLETTDAFHPCISSVLNITPDHLNRHHTMENYAAVKFSITKNQTKEDTCVLNYMDPWCREFAPSCPAKVVWFSSGDRPENGYYLKGEDIWQITDAGDVRLMNVHEMQLVGVHNAENVMAAIAMAAAFGIPMNNILTTVRNFKAVAHRIEYVATKKGVVWYNDSKGTNPDAAIRGIRAMDRPTILIGGGYDKQNEYDEWIESFDGKVKLFVLIGQTREKIAACAKAHGVENIVLADSFEECMDICAANAVSGDAVLLSPACASWGMFPNYEVRGEMFKEYVNKLED